MFKKVFLLLIILSISACKKMPQPGASEVAATPPAAATGGVVIARLNGQDITDEQIRSLVGPKLAQAELELYEVRKDGLDQVVEDRLLEEEAKKENTTKAELLKKSVYDKIKIEDRDIQKFYNENKSQVGSKSLAEMTGNIKGYLYRQQYQKYYGDLTDKLKKKSEFEVLIKAPRIEIEEGEGNAAIGPKDAPIKIVEFTDYQCPFCGRARAAINQVLDTYKGKVRYVMRDFPLSFHKDAQKAHESSHCANDQGKYWEMNKKLFASQSAIKVADLRKYAGELKLNMTKFNECLDSGKYAQRVQQNQEYGEKAGVSGTPAFFINGRMLSGARPFDAFKEVIDDELRNLKD